MTLNTNQVKSWIQSVTVWGGILSASANVAGAYFHLEFPADFTATVSTAIVGVIGGAIVIFGRIKAVKKIG